MIDKFARFRAYLDESIWRKRILYSLIGAIGGFSYYYFIGCRSGSCPISGNPWISTIYGVAVGIIPTFGKSGKLPPKKNPD